jgi:hypothetical protein
MGYGEMEIIDDTKLVQSNKNSLEDTVAVAIA